MSIRSWAVKGSVFASKGSGIVIIPTSWTRAERANRVRATASYVRPRPILIARMATLIA